MRPRAGSFLPPLVTTGMCHHKRGKHQLWKKKVGEEMVSFENGVKGEGKK